MLDVFRLAGEATRRTRPDGTIERGYWASYFLRGVRNHGGPEYAHQLLRKEGTTDGFQRLREEGRLDLTMEALVLRPEYTTLFTDEERRVAAHRLDPIGSCQAPDPQAGSKSAPLRQTPQTRLRALRMQCPRAFIFDLPAVRFRW